MAREGESMTGTLITLGVIGAAAYLAWQWLQSACGAGGSMTGNWMCGALGVSPAAAATTPTQVPSQTTQSSTTALPPLTEPCVGPPWYTQASCAQITGTWGPAPPNCGAPAGYGICVLPSGQPVPGPVVVSTPVQGAPASAGSVGSPTSVITGTLQQLASQNAFFQQQGGEGDAYQWAALWAQAGQPSFNVNSIFYPNGIAAASGSGSGFSSGNLPLISVSQFLSALSSAGISPSGMSGINRIPAAMIHLGRVM